MTHMISRSVFVLLLFSLSAFGQSDAPPADVVPYAGLSPQDAAEKATLPPGFKMHVFASEPDIVQPIAFCQKFLRFFYYHQSPLPWIIPACRL